MKMKIHLLFIAIIFVTSFVVQLKAKETFNQCCKYGKEAGEGLRKRGYSICNRRPIKITQTSGKMCRLVYKVCCISKETEDACNRGSQDSLRPEFSDCHFSSEVNTRHGAAYLKCCECCQMGKVAAKEGKDCKTEYSMGKICDTKYQTCCERAKRAKNGPRTCQEKQCSHSCKLVNGGPICYCRSGYRLQNDSRGCADIDECKENTHRCLGGYVCQNLIGSFRCQRPSKVLQCRPGYVQYDTYCRDEDECVTGKAHCPTGTVCENTLGGFQCSKKQSNESKCPDGYYTNNGRCIDVNECRSQRPCRADEKCVNTFGSYKCEEKSVSCPKGYKAVTGKTSCQDIDECKEGGHGCTRRGEMCANSVGSYRCTCKVGYIRKNFRCVDRDECELYGKRICTHGCLNLPGSFKCICSAGFKLGANNRTCLDIDECTESTCPSGHHCYNAIGTYKCIPTECPNYYLSKKKNTCELKCPFAIDCSRLPTLIKWHAVSRRGPLAKYRFRLVYSVNGDAIFKGTRFRFYKEKGDNDGIFGLRRYGASRVMIYNAKHILKSSQFTLTIIGKSTTNPEITIEYHLYAFVYVK